MDIYSTENHRTYVTVPLTEKKEAALTIANKHFCTSKARLDIKFGWVKDETLYFKETPGATKCWMVWRKTNKEL